MWNFIDAQNAKKNVGNIFARRHELSHNEESHKPKSLSGPDSPPQVLGTDYSCGPRGYNLWLG